MKTIIQQGWLLVRISVSRSAEYTIVTARQIWAHASLLAILAFPTSAFAVSAIDEATRIYKSGDAERALQVLDQEIAVNPKDAQARFLRSAWLAQQNRTEDAIATLVRMTEDFPELPEPYNNLGVLYAKKGDYERAKDALQMAIFARPDYAVAYENLADIYTRLAAQYYERAISLDKNLASARGKLESLRASEAPVSSRSATTIP